MNNLPVADIKIAGYENIYYDCPTCRSENVINRVTDLDPMATTSGMIVKCQMADCGKPLWLKGDFIQSAVYRWFLVELPLLKNRKLYRDYALSLCQASESFFLRAIINKKFDRSADYRNSEGHVLLAEYNKAVNEYGDSISRKTFPRMRDEFLGVFQAEREAIYPRSEYKNEDKRSWAFEVIENSNIDNLRNKVVHKNAYRPRLKDIEEHEDLIKALYWLGDYLKVLDSSFLLNRNFKQL